MKKNQHLSLVVIFLMLCLGATSQIGINTLTPDVSAALHIQPPSGQYKGLLIPKMHQANRAAMAYAAKGLMVFDTTNSMFYVSLATGTPNWHAMNPLVTKASIGTPTVAYTHSSITRLGIGTTNPAATLDVAGDINASTSVSTPSVTTNALTTNSIAVAGFAANAMVPTGAIIMWSGATLPAGWAYCDGTAGRPDLRGRFIVGYDPASAAGPAVLSGTATANVSNYGTIGNRGGENAHTLNVAEMPGHTHNVSASAQHSSFNFGGPGNSWIGNGTDYSGDPYNLPIGISETPKGGDQPHESRPPYYVLAYIIKL